MDFWKAIILGIIQGLTEFLPVSSSGHLALAQYFFGIKEPQLFFDVMLHVGTLGAVIVVFQRDIRDIFLALLGREPASRSDPAYQMTKKSGRLFALLVILGSVPTVIIAMIFKTFIEKLFIMPLFVSGMLFVTGIILWLSGKFSPTDTEPREINTTSALIIGTVQGLATLPGISRSGITISAALMRGVDRAKAARFSLLLSVPAILGATLLELKDVASVDIPVWTIIAGTLAAFVVGYAAIKVLLNVLKKGQFSQFAYYCWGVGIVAVVGYVVKARIG